MTRLVRHNVALTTQIFGGPGPDDGLFVCLRNLHFRVG
jgi:hypothetical protein